MDAPTSPSSSSNAGPGPHAGDRASSGAAYVQVAPAAELPPGTLKRFIVNNHAVAVANVRGRLWAFEDRCLHWGVRLSDGVLEEDVVRCRAHGWRHSLGKGEVVASNPPGDEGRRLTRYPAKVQDGYLWVGTQPLIS